MVAFRSKHRFQGPESDVMRLAERVATLISYGGSKKNIVDRCREDGYADDDIFLAWHAAQMMLRDRTEDR